MKTRRFFILGGLACLAAIVLAPFSMAGQTDSLFAGTWEGKVNGLPSVSLKIGEVDGKISGIIVFYFQERSDVNSPWHVAGEAAGPILAPQVEGKTLTFEVEHHKCHGCAELGPNVKFSLALEAPNEARFRKLGDEEDSGPGFRMIRRADNEAGAVQALRKGISVELAVTSHAIAMPDADSANAMVVAVTEKGDVYAGIDPITPAALVEEVKRDLSSQTEKMLYIKADARTPYAKVMEVLDAVRKAGVTAPNLLTGQYEAPEPGKLVPPKGLEVLVGPSSPPGAESTVVQLLNSTQQWPVVKINSEEIPWASFEGRLKQLLTKRSAKAVLVKADGRLPFARVVQVIDVCRSAGAEVFLSAPAT